MMYSPFRHVGSVFRKNRVIHLTFFVTRRCNLRCPFCFSLSGKDSTAAADELSLTEVGRVSRSLGTLLWLAFSGGEIFLRDDLVEIAGIFYRNNRPAIMLFPTNGMLPEVIRERTEDILRRCSKSVVVVKISLDGPEGIHDKLRGRKGAFEKTLTTYHLLGDLVQKYPHFELGINTVFCSENQDLMDETIDLVARMKNVKTHTISMVRGHPAEQGFRRVDTGKYHAAVERLERNLKNRTSPTYRFRGARIKAAQDIVQRRLIHRTAAERRRLIPCYAGRLNLVLTETGDVYPCEILAETFGNVREHDYDVGSVIRSERAVKVLESIAGNCCYCTHECYFMTNILFNPRTYPLLAREYLQL